ncbi:MAG: HD-GYP domain-containing protein [Pseudomonadota bacterium]
MRLVEVSAINLRPGMFVAELDRPWLDTPFSIQGFVVRDDDDVMYVAKHVDHVYVDADYHGGDIFLPQTESSSIALGGGGVLSLKADFAQAKLSFASAADTLDGVFNSLNGGLELDIGTVKDAVRPLIDSVFQNSQAVAALARMKDTGEYRYNHSIAMAVWAAILGRHIGLHRDELEKLVTGCAMCDVGMSRIPREILDQSESLSDKQRKQIRAHTQLGVDLLKRSKNVDLEIVVVVESHHERHDGSGYPKGLSGSEISLLARIAGLVDSYDAMISTRPHAPGRSSFEATQELLDSKNILFQGALVEQFVQAIGLFPVTALVELNTGEVAIVVEQNPMRRLKPEVLIVLDAQKQAKQHNELLNLADRQLVGEEARWIVRELAPGTYGIDSQDFFI